MKILLIHNFYKQYGGEDKVVEEQAKLLEAYGHSVYCYFKKNDQIDKAKKIKIFYDAYYSKDTESEMTSIIHSFKPDIAHVHNIFPIISPSIYQILTRYKIPIIQTLHNYRFICPNGLMFNKGEICEKCLTKDNYYCCGFNKCYHSSFFQSFWYADIVSRAYKKSIFNGISRFISLNEFVKEKMVQRGFPIGKISLIPNFSERPKELPKYQKDNYILYIGRLSEEKGIMTLIEAMRGIVSSRLKIVGNGELREQIEKHITSNNMGNIELLGFKSGTEKNELISRAKAIVVPSEWYENFPTVVLEAFSHGTPAIVSAIGGVQYMVENYFNGLKFQPKNPSNLKEKINYILVNEESSLQISKNAYKTYLENYTPEIHYQRLMNLYNEVILEYSGEKLQCKELV